MKGGSVLITVSFYTSNCLLRLPTTITKTPPASSLIPLAASTRTRLSFYSSGRSVPSEIHEKSDPKDSSDDVIRKELIKGVEKYFDGVKEAMPSIFEAILERKLAKLEGKLDEKVEELMEKILGRGKRCMAIPNTTKISKPNPNPIPIQINFSEADEEIDVLGVARHIVDK